MFHELQLRVVYLPGGAWILAVSMANVFGASSLSNCQEERGEGEEGKKRRNHLMSTEHTLLLNIEWLLSNTRFKAFIKFNLKRIQQ